MDDKIYLPVDGVKFEDLLDWSDSRMKCPKTMSVKKPGLLRQNSHSGSLIDCNEEKIAVFRHGDKVYAIQEKCPHAGGPLHLGDIEDLPSGKGICVRCPWHSWRIDLDNGHVVMPKGRQLRTPVYPVRVNSDGTLSIGFDKFADIYFSAEQDF